MKRVFSILFIGLLTFSTVHAQDAKTVVDKMISALSEGKAYQYTMKQTERINGKIYKNTIFTKVNESPKKIFIDNVEGDNKGVQVLYVSGERENKALINKMFGVKLSPYNSLIRKNQHHTILESGFGTITTLLKDARTRSTAQGKFNEVFVLEGSVTFDGKSCYKLILNDPTFTYTTYKPSSTVSTYRVATDNKVCEQLLCEANNMSFGDLKAGNTYKIPTSYAKKTILYVDKTTFFPVYQEMFDDKGMFEKYEFSGLKINPSFTSNDFSETNSSYNF